MPVSDCRIGSYFEHWMALVCVCACACVCVGGLRFVKKISFAKHYAGLVCIRLISLQSRKECIVNVLVGGSSPAAATFRKDKDKSYGYCRHPRKTIITAYVRQSIEQHTKFIQV